MAACWWPTVPEDDVEVESEVTPGRVLHPLSQTWFDDGYQTRKLAASPILDISTIVTASGRVT